MRVRNEFCLQVESTYLTSVIAQCPDEGIAAAPTDTYFRTRPALGNASAFYLRDSFSISNCLDIGSLHESKIESENSWEYSSLHLSPDVTRTADTLFGEFEEFETI